MAFSSACSCSTRQSEHSARCPRLDVMSAPRQTNSRLARMRRLLLGLVVAGLGRRGYRLLASGALTIDLGVGRRTRPLGPLSWEIAAARETVFEVISGPY